MRAFAALLLLSGFFMATLGAHNGEPQSSAFQQSVYTLVTRVLRQLDPRQYPVKWPERIVTCARSIGVNKCIRALSTWRADNAVDSLMLDRDTKFDFARELDEFPWERYSNSSDEMLDDGMAKGAVNLLRYRSLSLSALSGYQIELDSKRNGSLNIDVYSNDLEFGRSSRKKMLKRFYRIVPILLIPGLIMAAILPFVLPALKMMTVGVGILNQMALSGAIFTLLRNNAFNDKYTKKIIYVNEGYKNERDTAYHEEESQNVLYNDGGKFNMKPDFGGPIIAPSVWLNDNYDEGADVEESNMYNQYIINRNDVTKSANVN